MPKVSGKRVRDEFFTLKDSDANVWECKCGKQRKAGRRYENFLSHVRKEHPDALNALNEDCSQVSTTLNRETVSLFFPKNITNSCMDRLCCNGLVAI